MAKELVYVFTGDTAELEQALALVRGKAVDADQALRDIGDKGGKGLDLAEKAAKRAGAAMLAAGAAATAAVLGMAKATLDYAARVDQIAKDAKRVGATAEEFQKLTGALSLGGIEAGTAAEMMKKLNVLLGDAKAGAGSARGALDALGLTLDEVTRLPLPERVALLADRIDALPSPADKARVAVDLFGRAGVDLVAAFEGGGAALREAISQIEAVGVVSNQAAANAEILSDEYELLQRSLQSTADTVFGEAAPALTGIIQITKDLLGEFRQSGAARDFGRTLGDVFITVAEVAAISMNTVRRATTLVEPAFKSLEIAGRSVQVLFRVMARDFSGAKEAFEQGQNASYELRDALADMVKQAGAADETTEEFLARLNMLRLRLDAVASSADTASTAVGGMGSAMGANSAPAGGGKAGGGGDSLGLDLEGTSILGESFDFEDPLADLDLLGASILETFTDIVPSALETANESFNEWKDTWSSGIGTVITEVGRLAAGIFEDLADVAGEAMDEYVNKANETAEKIEEIDRKLAASTSQAEKERLRDKKKRLTEEEKAQKKAALEAFRVQKALAIVAAAINTALAIINAFATAPTIIAGVALAVVAGAAGAIAIAKIASQKPPQFHRGGMVHPAAFTPSANSTPDSRATSLRDWEGVLNPNGVRMAGGESGLNRLNRGQPAQPQALEANLYLNDRTLDVFEARTARRSGGAAAAMRSGERLPDTRMSA